jgi:hypothetical protein
MAIAVTSPAVGRLAAALGLERCRSATISLGVDEVVMIRAQQYAEVNQLTRMAAELETNEYVVITRHEYDKLKAEASPFADAAERSSTVSKTGEGQSGMRTERVVLEITRPAIANYPAPAKQFMWQHLLRNVVQGDRESVRVVEEACPDAWAQTFARLEAERDAAIRERQKLEARVAELEAASGGNLPETPDGSSQAAKPELPTG